MVQKAGEEGPSASAEADRKQGVMKKHPTVVIKLGSSSIVDEKTHQPLLSILALIVEAAIALRRNGYKVVIVSSGAIAVGLQRMNLPRRPKHLPQVQALAAIGQCRLIELWSQLFERLNQPVAQILLTRNDIADRTQYLNAQNTITELLHMGVIPIVNENDTIVVSEIKFGDNDTLSAITAGMVQADYLFLMTDVDCLYDKNPRTNPDAKPIEVVEDISKLEADTSSAGSSLGTGGMATKIVAARLATAAGVMTIITKSSKPGNLPSIVAHLEALAARKRASLPTKPASNDGTIINTTPAETVEPLTIPAAPLHTRFLPSDHPIRDRYFWITHGLQTHGTIYIDSGAAHALSEKANLLPVGIIDVEGHFAQSECVRLVQIPRPKAPALSQDRPAGPARTFSGIRTPPPTSPQLGKDPSFPFSLNDHASREIGRAIVNYSAAELRLIAGLRSSEIAKALGYADTEYVAYRENVALAVTESRPSTPGPQNLATQALLNHAVNTLAPESEHQTLPLVGNTSSGTEA